MNQWHDNLHHNLAINWLALAMTMQSHEYYKESEVPMKKLSLLAASVLALTACAKQPDQIAAVEVGADSYARYSCSQLRNEKTKISQELENLSAKQKSAASGDAWGVFLLGLPVSSMSGNDQEAMISIAKGKIQAIDRQMVAKNCK